MRSGRSAALLLLFMLALPAAGPASPHAVSAEALGQIAFVTTRDGTSEIYTMNADGSGQSRLTVNPAEDVSPAWSPDGSRIAFSSNRDGNWEIYTIDDRGESLARITDNASFDGAPAWSPDGTKIALATARDGNSEIYVIGADGRDAIRVTDDDDVDTSPAWAPDTPACDTRAGSIAFVSNRDADYDIYVAREDGSELENLTNTAASEFNPAWAPDCSAVIFDRATNGNYDVFELNLATRTERRLTVHPREDSRPSFSPDGTSIAFTSLRDGHYEVFVTDDGGQEPQNLSNSFPGADLEPDWRPTPPMPLRRSLRAPLGRHGPRAAKARQIQLTCTRGPMAGKRIRGTNSNDVICSVDVSQVLDGRGGHDAILDQGGRDTIYGGRGRDTIYSRDGEPDVITGGLGVDRIYPDLDDVVRQSTGDAIIP